MGSTARPIAMTTEKKSFLRVLASLTPNYRRVCAVGRKTQGESGPHPIKCRQ